MPPYLRTPIHTMLVVFALQRHAALGMHYLHTQQPPVVHRDLKSANLLLDAHWTAKVCDFGLSRIMEGVELSGVATQNMVGTCQWAAPELLRGEALAAACDVWSFGVVVWELLTGAHPFAGQLPVQVVSTEGWGTTRGAG